MPVNLPALSVLDGDLAEVHVTRVVINSGGRLGLAGNDDRGITFGTCE